MKTVMETHLKIFLNHLEEIFVEQTKSGENAPQWTEVLDHQVEQEVLPSIAGCIDHPNGNGGDNT